MELSLLDIEHFLDKKTGRGGNHEINLGFSERIASFAAGAFILIRSLRGIQAHPKSSVSLGLSGAYLLYRGLTGKCTIYEQLDKANEQLSPIIIETSLEVDKPRNEVYAFWRKLENMPLFMQHLESVTELDRKRSSWELKVPGNMFSVSWEANLIKEDKNKFLSWRSADNAMIENSGSIGFHDLPGKNGTLVNVFISYRPPASAIGSGIARLFNPVFKRMIERDVARFKTYIEKG